MNVTQLASQKYGTHFGNRFYYRLGKNPPLWTLTRTTLTLATLTYYGFLNVKGLLHNKLITAHENDIVCNKQEKW
jgi:hypothetical protein